MELACRKCNLIISQGNACPVCNASDLTSKWSGYIAMLNVEKSDVAKRMEIKVNGSYALSING
jgi:DNA-directed RNA polymerase subunit E"